ncbi:MAG: hypothetical protein DMF63_07365 [Acidobacteria bacterium]|nr:MAG: hypothetical protein DMF63_07365 [Acidobacteriota bacterium]
MPIHSRHFSEAASATSQHVAATRSVADLVSEGLTAKRILDGIVKNVYADNVGKLAAWLSASHVESASAAAKSPATTPAAG